MSSEQQKTALIALQEAGRLRHNLGYKIWDAICPYDCAEQLGIEVRFIDIPSLEGMYSKGSPPTILISSLRPAGRAAYTCAHEIAHYVFNHGTHIDIDLTQPFKYKIYQEEFLAQAFAGFFLISKTALENAFTLRGWSITSPTPKQIYALSSWFGVGYETLINHMDYSLRLLSKDKVKELKNITLEQIKYSITNEKVPANMVWVDEYWTRKSIDVQVGDIILLPQGTLYEGKNSKILRVKESFGDFYQATAPGIGRFFSHQSNWSAYLRVSRQGYIGRSIFRFLEDPDYD